MTIQLFFVIGGAVVLGAILMYLVMQWAKRNERKGSTPVPGMDLEKVPSVPSFEERRSQSFSAPEPEKPAEPPVKPASASELLKRIAEASEVEDVQKVMGESTDPSVTRAGEARIVSLITAKLAEAVTIQECLTIYDDTPAVDDGKVDTAGDAVLERAFALSTDFDSCKEVIEWFDGNWPSDDYQMRVLEKAASFAITFEQALSLRKGLDESEARSMPIFERAYALASTTEEAIELYDTLDADTEFAARVHDKARSLVTSLDDALDMGERLDATEESTFEFFERVLDLSEEQYTKGALSQEDFERVLDLFISLDVDTDTGELSVRMRAKLLSLVATVEEALNLYDKFEKDYEDYEFAQQVLDKAVELATTLEECDSIREKVVTADDEMDVRIVARSLTFVTTVEECAEFWRDLDMDSPVAQAAILRAADIIRATP
jgi:hypothetical protein